MTTAGRAFVSTAPGNTPMIYIPRRQADFCSSSSSKRLSEAEVKSRMSWSDHESDQSIVVVGASAAKRRASDDNSSAAAGGRRRNASTSSDSFALSCILARLEISIALPYGNERGRTCAAPAGRTAATQRFRPAIFASLLQIPVGALQAGLTSPEGCFLSIPANRHRQ
jgi:hypothetical protein